MREKPENNPPIPPAPNALPPEPPKTIRIKPISDVSPVWERDGSLYPDLIRVAMENGQVVTYRMDIKQPHPSFEGAVGTIREWAQQDVGYQYQPKHVQKKSRWERFLAARQKK